MQLVSYDNIVSSTRRLAEQTDINTTANTAAMLHETGWFITRIEKVSHRRTRMYDDDWGHVQRMRCEGTLLTSKNDVPKRGAV